MDFEQQGIYVFLLDQQWLNGSLPGDPEAIRAILHLDKETFEKAWVKVGLCFELIDGRFVNPRLAREREKRLQFREKQAENGKLGGRPMGSRGRVPGSNDKAKTQNNPSLNSGLSQKKAKKSLPSPSPSASPCSENENSPHIPPLPPAGDAEIPKNLEVCWKEWLAYRRERKLPAFKPITIKKQIAFLAAQPDPAACVNQSILNGWQGLFELKASPNQASRPDEIEAMKARLRAEGYQ